MRVWMKAKSEGAKLQFGIWPIDNYHATHAKFHYNSGMRLQHPLCAMQTRFVHWSTSWPWGGRSVGGSSGAAQSHEGCECLGGLASRWVNGRGVSFICDKAVAPHINYSPKYLFMRAKHEFTHSPRRYFAELVVGVFFHGRVKREGLRLIPA
jgi:hypothetical protein